MTRPKLFATVSLLATVCAFSAANAQTGTPPKAPTSPPSSSSSSSAPPDVGPASEPAAEGVPWPILFVTSVEVIRSAREGGMDIVRARGLVTSNVWTSPHILPINSGPAIDGILDLIFQANTPQTPGPMGPFMEVEAILPIAPGHPYKGVRVRSGTNAVTVKVMPGFAESKFSKDDCSKCIGKYFVAKGATPPAGIAAGDIVRQEDLPADLRVIRPDQGIPNYRFDPNRLTLVLTEDGRISDGAWD